MITVHRYEMPDPGATLVHDMPIAHRCVHFGIKDESRRLPVWLHAWFVVDTDSPSVPVEFSTIPTGQELQPSQNYLATYVDLPTQTVWHLVEKELP